MSCDRGMQHAVASHRVMAAALERDRQAELARRQDEHRAREQAEKEKGRTDEP